MKQTAHEHFSLLFLGVPPHTAQPKKLMFKKKSAGACAPERKVAAETQPRSTPLQREDPTRNAFAASTYAVGTP
jgi:hypothetical protein